MTQIPQNPWDPRFQTPGAMRSFYDRQINGYVPQGYVAYGPSAQSGFVQPLSTFVQPGSVAPQRLNGQFASVSTAYGQPAFTQPAYGLPAYGQPIASQSVYAQAPMNPFPYGQQIRNRTSFDRSVSNPSTNANYVSDYPAYAPSYGVESATDQFANASLAPTSSEHAMIDRMANDTLPTSDMSLESAPLSDCCCEELTDNDPEYSLEELHEMEFELPSEFEEGALPMSTLQSSEGSIGDASEEAAHVPIPRIEAEADPLTESSSSHSFAKDASSGSEPLSDQKETEEQIGGPEKPGNEFDEQYQTQEMEPSEPYQLPLSNDNSGNGDLMNQGSPVIQIQQPRKSRGWIVGLVAVLCIFALMLYGMISCSRILGADSSESVLLSQNTVAVIEIDGTIQYDGSANSPEGLSQLLDYAEQTDAIKAVVLRVNSGGGVATAGEEMANLVRDFSKPIVVSSASMNASAAYEISSQADYIFVSKTTEIGSIGTALELTNLSGLMELLGIDVEVITSSDSKDSMYGYRPLTDEEREYYQRMIDQINDVFIDNVAEGRGMTKNAVRQLATGLVFTGIDAVENGLADEIGSREDALDYAAQLAGLEEYATYDLGFTSSNLDFLSRLI